MQASRFVYDGKEAGIELLITKARSSVRQSSTGEWRKWNAEDDEDDNEDGYVFISCDSFFATHWKERPAGMSRRVYDKLSQQAYDALVHYLQ